MQLVARKVQDHSAYGIFALQDGCAFEQGQIVADRFGYTAILRDVFGWDEQACVFSDRDLRKVLAGVRSVLERAHHDACAEAEAERYAENAWLRAAEQGSWEDFEEDNLEREKAAFFGTHY